MTVVGLCWMSSAGLALLPALGWNSGQWSGTCSIPHVWSDTYLAVATSVIFGAAGLYVVVLAVVFLAVASDERR